MPRFEIDLSDLFEEITDDQLIAEMNERELSTCNCQCECEEDDVLSSRRETLQLLRDCANFLRDNEKPSWALGLDDLMSELGLV